MPIVRAQTQSSFSAARQCLRFQFGNLDHTQEVPNKFLQEVSHHLTPPGLTFIHSFTYLLATNAGHCGILNVTELQEQHCTMALPLPIRSFSFFPLLYTYCIFSLSSN
jgi:hypothetical protein